MAQTYTFDGGKWPSNTITWSFAGTSYAQDNAAGLPVFDTMAMTPVFASLIQKAFDAWQAVTHVRFVRLSDAGTQDQSADIRIGFGTLSGGTTIDAIGVTFLRTNSGYFFHDTLIYLEDYNQRELLPNNSGNFTYAGTTSELYQTIVHEIGHAIGLGHDSDPNAIMYPVALQSSRNISLSDIAGVNALYPIATPVQTTAPAPTPTPTPTAGYNGVVLRLDAKTGILSTQPAPAYPGPVAVLQSEYFTLTDDSVAMVAQTPNMYLVAGAGNDAIQVLTGDNVIDAGGGNNAIVSGSGNDTILVSFPGAGKSTWDLIQNFHKGDSVTVLGFDASGGSLLALADTFATGATVSLDIAHSGVFNTKISFFGVSGADAAKFAYTNGVINGVPYLKISA